MSFRVVIPACYKSFRLPGKPLLDICGKPMIQHVYERALQSGAESVVIATEDERIQKAALAFGALVCMTSSDHQSGTERLAESLVVLGYEDSEVVVNLPCDFPLVSPDVIHQVARELEEHDNIKMATLCEPIQDVDMLFNPDIVKVAMNRRGYACYFSRAPIPWERGIFNQKKEMKGVHYRHIGIYAYRCSFLEEYMRWDLCEVEKMERLEQLRVLWNSGRIYVAISKKSVPFDVNTAEDLERAKEHIHSSEKVSG